MSGAAAPDHRFHRAVTAADDEIVTVEIEELDNGREERKVLTIERARPGQPLHERALDPMPLDTPGYRAWHLNECVEGGVRIQLADGVEDFLSSPHPGQPVVHDGDLRWPRMSVQSESTSP